MCGILGGLWFKNQAAPVERLQAAIKTLSVRGPDDNGLEFYNVADANVALGHTRLSVIDLTAGGHQPMYSACGRYAMVYNGEVYNYRELRAELMQEGFSFHTESDTEVLLAAWQAWGKGGLHRLTGMFAFVVLDRQQGSLTCVRDAFGIKPLFYTQEGSSFLFASELPAIKAMKQNKTELNMQRAYDYLVYGEYDTDTQTFFKDVLQLAPGYMFSICLTSGEMTEPERWWRPTIIENTKLSFSDATQLVREQFLQNIKLHLRSDVALGAALSGGIDSSAVVCAMRHVEPDAPIHTFSYIAKDSAVSEEVWVDKVNAYVGAKGHKVVVTGDDLANDLEDMIRTQGEPFGSTSIYAQYRVFKLARENGVTVTLDGQGADEMLAGYHGYVGQRLHSLIETGQIATAFSFLNRWSEWPGRSLGNAVKSGVSELTEGPIYSFLRKLKGTDKVPSWINSEYLLAEGIELQLPRLRPEEQVPGRRVCAELARSLTKRGLPALLRHGDRNSMRFSVESRVPFLTTDFVNLTLSLPESYLVSNFGESKHIFREAMRGIVPDEILDRRDKIGFQTPEANLIKSIASKLRVWLVNDLDLSFVNKAEVLREFDLFVEGKLPFNNKIWRWINFSLWNKLFIKTIN